MTYIIIGLGNPGEEYEGTRHNTGRMAVELLRAKWGLPDWRPDGKSNSLVSVGKVEISNSGEGTGANKKGASEFSVQLVMPEGMMNNSGASVAKLVTSAKQAEQTIVIYDDLDLPLGTFKISYDRSSGGHRGLESIIKKLKTTKFVRIRVGNSPTTPGGKLKKPTSEAAIIKFILGEFSPKETLVLKKVLKKVTETAEAVIADGRERAMGRFNR